MQKKIKDALNEGRILILGSQILIGFQWHSVFQKGYEKLPLLLQAFGIGTLMLALVLFGLLIAPVCYHGIVAKGMDTPQLHSFSTRTTEAALIPFSAVLGMDLFISSSTLVSYGLASAVGLIGLFSALFLWFGIEAFYLRSHSPGPSPADGQDEPTTLSAKIDHVLTEARMVLPGAQALLGFQFILFFSESFEKLPDFSKFLHLSSLALVCFCVVLLMTPAAFHRIVEGGEDTERFFRVANRLVLGAMVPLALAASIEFYIVAAKVAPKSPFAALASMAIGLYFFLFWFGFTFYVRTQKNNRA